MVIVALLLIAAMLRTAVPYTFAALGGLWSERAGVVNIALEGIILFGAFASTLGTDRGGTVKGVIAGVLAAALAGLLFGVLTIYANANPIVIGVALNLFADGATRFGLRVVYASSANSPRVDGWWRVGPAGIFHPLLWLALIATLVTWWALRRTRFGLRVRAAGDAPAALDAAGIDTRRVQLAAITVGAMLAGLGGVFLAWNAHQFVSGMSNGRGYMALAALVIGRWRALPVALTAVGLGLAEAVAVLLESQGYALPSWLVQMLPYVATLILLALVNRRYAQR